MILEDNQLIPGASLHHVAVMLSPVKGTVVTAETPQVKGPSVAILSEQEEEQEQEQEQELEQALLTLSSVLHHPNLPSVCQSG